MSGFQEANDYLDSLEEKLQKAYREYMQKGIIPSTDMLKQVLSPKEENAVVKKEAFFEYFEDFINSAKMKGKKYNTIRNYISKRNHLLAFQTYSSIKLDAETYDLRIHDKLLEYLIYEVEQAPNSVFSVVKNLKVFLKFLADERSVKLHPDVAKIQASYVSVEKMFLTWEEIEKLRAAPLRENLDKVRDVYLFACYTGLRYSDVWKLNPVHLVDRGGYKVISLVQTKTGKRIEIALNSLALAILKKYEGQYVNCLPVIVNQKLNYHLKEVGELAGIDGMVEKLVFEKGKASTVLVPKYELITMHTARHTFATQSLMKGMPVEVLQKILGHNKIQNTMVYAKVVDEFKHKVMLDVWG